MAGAGGKEFKAGIFMKKSISGIHYGIFHYPGHLQTSYIENCPYIRLICRFRIHFILLYLYEKK